MLALYILLVGNLKGVQQCSSWQTADWIPLPRLLPSCAGSAMLDKKMQLYHATYRTWKSINPYKTPSHYQIGQDESQSLVFLLSRLCQLSEWISRQTNNQIFKAILLNLLFLIDRVRMPILDQTELKDKLQAWLCSVLPLSHPFSTVVVPLTSEDYTDTWGGRQKSGPQCLIAILTELF